MILHKLLKNGPRLPYLLAARLKMAAMMAYYRNIAEIGSGSRVENDGLIINPPGERARIRIGRGCIVRGELFSPAQGGGIVMGDDCYVGTGSYVWAWDPAGMTIGDRVQISHHVNIHDSNCHSLDPIQRNRHFQAIVAAGHPDFVPDVECAPITIGDDVWIGHGASIAKGVTIGEGAMVAHHAVVLRDVAPWTVAAGFPAVKVMSLDRSRATLERLAQEA